MVGAAISCTFILLLEKNVPVCWASVLPNHIAGTVWVKAISMIIITHNALSGACAASFLIMWALAYAGMLNKPFLYHLPSLT